MSDRIAQSLSGLFEERRVIFWYDPAREMRGDYEAVSLSDVTKLEIVNNEFGLKYRLLRQEPTGKFLLYHAGPRPADADNWLLDVLLANVEFRADQTALWLTELGLELGFAPVVSEHAEFFKAKSRIEALKKALKSGDTPAMMRLRMLSVCAGAVGGLDTVLETLLGDLAAGKEEGYRLVERCGLNDFLWKQVTSFYGYSSPSPSVEDFAITLFKACFLMGVSEDAPLNSEALVLLRRWKNDKSGSGPFEALSKRFEGPLNVKSNLGKRDFRNLMALDVFEEVDREIIRKIVQGMASQTVTPAEVQRWVLERRSSHWFERYEDIYFAIESAAEFLKAFHGVNLGMTSAAEGFERYASTWFRLDQHYRRFIYHYRKSAQAATLLSSLFKLVEDLYGTNYLLKLNDAWQEQVNKMTAWKIPGVPSQADFYKAEVLAFRRKDQKVCVVISDAMRFEVADECLSRIKSLDRFDAELKPMLGVLPSYTQLGMASLLPHKNLLIADDVTGQVFDGEQSTMGQANREKLLASGREGDRTITFRFEDFMGLKVEEAKAVFRDHDVIYIYHNRIDAIGDKLPTEESLADAVEDALGEIVTVVRKLASANATNILITADHGFIYQHRQLEESDFSSADVQGGVLLKNRRFVVGKGLPETPGMKKFTSADLGLGGALDVLIPNSINRLRVKGSGSRFVHGGASLQEIVVPVILAGKGRESDVRPVDVQIINSGKNLITSGQLAVLLYQVQPVSEKRQERQLRAGIFAGDGTLISDIHDLTFASNSDNTREREKQQKFLLSRLADTFNNQDVFLRLEERVGKTSHYQEYASLRFQLKRGISADFDF